ncbi:MAG: hypothetical protein H0U73_11660 [Tatlockia sp.]|nr:hypothetical protein [Tatlockia sp.]
MGIWEFLSIYWRNVKGTFKKGFIEPIFDLAAFVWISHIALMPITLTLGALLKTVVDFFSRKANEIPEDVLKVQKDEIANFNKENMESLVKEISAYTPKSNSSQMLLKELNQLNSPQRVNKIVNETLEKKCEAKKLELFKHQDRFYGHKSGPLDTNHSTALDNYRKKLINHGYDNDKLALQKSLIKDFMNQDKNQGKETWHIIGMFKPNSKNEVEVKEPTYTSVNFQ